MPLPEKSIKPFLKWAGGKRWLVQAAGDVLPSTCGKYIEPFVGSGAVFFYLRPEKAVLSDKNVELIETYVAMRDEWQEVWRLLKVHQSKHTKSHYYAVRSSCPSTTAGRAARFIYLNRTCFNGLYRVNQQGCFNVPKGTKNTVIFPDDDFEAVSKALKAVSLASGDFETTILKAERGDFVFVDPPYTVQHNNNGFLKYNETIFSWADQVRLCGVLGRARDRGASIVISNADSPCIHGLYKKGFMLYRVRRASVLAASAARRRSTTELIITNYRIEKGCLERV